jgi:hypothetical protein
MVVTRNAVNMRKIATIPCALLGRLGCFSFGVDVTRLLRQHLAANAKLSPTFKNTPVRLARQKTSRGIAHNGYLDYEGAIDVDVSTALLRGSAQCWSKIGKN